MHIKINRPIEWTFFIAVGWILGLIAENFAIIQLDTNIPIFDIVTLLVTIFLACYVANILEKGVQDKRFEKNLIISKIDLLDENICGLSEICSSDASSSEIDFYKIMHLISTSRKSYFHYSKLIKNHYKLKEESVGNKIQENIRQKIRKLDNLCTYTSIGKIDRDIFIISGKVHYNNKRINEINILLESIQDDLSEIKLFVNSL